MTEDVRVLIVLPSLASGGAERVGANLAKMWVDEGWRVKVLTFGSADSDFYELDQRVGRVSLGLRMGSNGALASLWNSVRRIIAIRREITAYRADVVVALMSAASALAALAAIGTRARVVGCEHTHPPMQPLGLVRELVRKLVYRGLSATVALTDASRVWLERQTWSQRVLTIPNAVTWPLQPAPPIVDPELFCRRERQVLLAVGRLEPVKGFDDLIGVFAHLANKHSAWDLAIVGEGSERSRLNQIIVELGLSQRVSLPGRVGNVGAWYERASLFVMTSHYEGLPSALLEAMASGLAVVSFDCETGPRDIVRSGENGVLVRDRDLGMLERQLATLMVNESERKRLGAAAQSVRDMYSEQRVRDRWAELFVDLGVRRA